MENNKRPRQFAKGFSVALFVVAGLIFVFGVFLLIVFINMANAVTNYDIYFQMAGIMQFAQIILRPLQVGLINLGIIVFVILIVISMLLASAGWLIRRQSSLLARVEVLEDRLVSDGFQPQAFKD